MTLEVSVDELDINSVEIGQEAAVTFDAIEDKEFTGEVTEIGNTALVNGGVAKYTVSVSVPKDEEMKQGMNASATITIENRENVITIPVNALQEKGNKSFCLYRERRGWKPFRRDRSNHRTFRWNYRGDHRKDFLKEIPYIITNQEIRIVEAAMILVCLMVWAILVI